MATWLITGAGSGLGRETARYAIENGDQVAVTSRSKEKLQNLVELAPERVLPHLSQYENILIGHPIWWGIPLRMIASVIDDLNLNGKTLTGFATSGGSTYGRSQSYFARTVEQNGYDVTLNQGTILSNNDGQIATWLKSLTLK